MVDVIFVQTKHKCFLSAKFGLYWRLSNTACMGCLQSLGSKAYRPKLGEAGHFLLLHSVGSIPHNSEIDVPLNYADYYYLEALSRKAYIDLYFQKRNK